MMQFVHEHYAQSLVAAIVLGLTLCVLAVVLIVRLAPMKEGSPRT